MLITPDPDGDRGFSVAYRTTVLPREYDLRLRAEDGTGRVATAEFPVRVDAEWSFRRPGQNWIDLGEGERVLGVDSVRVRVRTPRNVAGSDLDLVIDADTLLEVVRIPTDPGTGGTARFWTVTSLDTIPQLGRTRPLVAGLTT
jgi:hypothetical protein